jgi:hypothetical protein
MLPMPLLLQLILLLTLRSRDDPTARLYQRQTTNYQLKTTAGDTVTATAAADFLLIVSII